MELSLKRYANVLLPTSQLWTPRFSWWSQENENVDFSIASDFYWSLIKGYIKCKNKEKPAFEDTYFGWFLNLRFKKKQNLCQESILLVLLISFCDSETKLHNFFDFETLDVKENQIVDQIP